jgi:hypothetical protein
MPLSPIFQLYPGGQFYWWMKPEYFWIGEKVYHVTLPWMEILGRYLDKDLTTFKLVPMY